MLQHDLFRDGLQIDVSRTVRHELPVTMNRIGW
jgi:hypothetical protein